MTTGRGKPIRQTEVDTALALIADGRTVSQAAHAIGRSHTGLSRALLETWPEEYEAAKERRRDRIRDRVWTLGMEQDADAVTMRWAIDHLTAWHLPEAHGDRLEDADAGGVAEAIDRFTATVLQLAQREPARALPPAAGGRPDVAALIPVAEGEG